MAKRKVMLKYPEQLIKEPVLFRMAKAYDVMPNIRRARVTEGHPAKASIKKTRAQAKEMRGTKTGRKKR